MTLTLVAIDESGNTGPDLLNQDQPTFVLASADFATDEATDILRPAAKTNVGEVKFTKLRKTHRGQEAIQEIMSAVVRNKDRFVVTVYHKRFMLYAKLVDLLAETAMHAADLNVYAEGLAPAMAHMHYFCMPAFCGRIRAEMLLARFLSFVCEQDKASAFVAFDKAIQAAERHSKQKEYNVTLEMLRVGASIIVKDPDLLRSESLDPAIPSFVDHCDKWGRRLSSGFNVIHDESKAVAKKQKLFAAMSGKSQEELLYGYKGRHAVFPLKLGALNFQDSKTDIRVRLVDVVAGTLNYYSSCHARDITEDPLCNKLDDIDVMSLVESALWPDPELATKTQELVGDGEQNPVDQLTTAIRKNLGNPR